MVNTMANKRPKTTPSSGKATSKSKMQPWARCAFVAVGVFLIVDYGVPLLLKSVPPGGPRDDVIAVGRAIAGNAYWVSGPLALVSLLLLAYDYIAARRRKTQEKASADAAEPSPEAVAAASALKLTPNTVSVEVVRKRPRWRAPEELVEVIVKWPPGRILEDPSLAVARSLTPMLGEPIRPSTWSAREGQAVFVAGSIPQPEPEPIPEPEPDPVKRSGQLMERLLKEELTATPTHFDKEDGRVTAWRLRYSPAAALKMAKEGNRTAVSNMLEEVLPPSKNGRGYLVVVEPRDYMITVRERQPMPPLVIHPVIDDYSTLFGEGELKLPFGTAEDDYIMAWDVGRKTAGPHALVVGPTGGGKTVTMSTLIIGATRQKIECVLIDPKQIELMGFEGWPGVTMLATDVEDMADLIDRVHADMNARYQLIRKGQAHPDELPPLLIALDEFLILKSMLTYWWQQQPKVRGVPKPGQPPQIQKIVDILALGRSAGDRVLLGVQRPDAELFKGGGARDNMRTRISLAQLSPDGAGMMWDDQSIGIKPTGVRGRGWATDNSGLPRETQLWLPPQLIDTPMYTDRMTPEDVALARALRPAPFEVRPSGLAAPVSAPAPSRRITPGTPADLYQDVVDVMAARELEAGMEVKLDRDGSGSWTQALIEDVDEVGDRIELEVLWSGGSGETIELDRGEEVLVVAIHDPAAL